MVFNMFVALAGLIGYAYPTAEISGDGRRFVRRWVVRVEGELPEQAELDDLGEKLVAQAQDVVLEAYSLQFSKEQLLGDLPSARLVRIAPKHCIVMIESPSPSLAVGDAAGIGTWGILRGVDETLAVEDLEGIPKRFWFPMRQVP